MALYTVIKYNQYFSKAACLSSAISMCFLQLQEDLKKMPKDEAAPLMMDALMKGLKGLQDD